MNHFSYKTFYRPSTKGKDGSISIYIRVLIDRIKKDYALKLHTNLKFWNESKNELKTGHIGWEADNTRIAYYLGELNTLKLTSMMDSKTITFLDTDKIFKGDANQKNSFYDFVESQIKLQEGKIKPATVAVWNSEVNKLKEHAPVLTWGMLNVQFLKGYESHLTTERKNTFITVHKSHRFIKARINDAINEGIIKESPYTRFKIGKAPEGNMERLTRAEVRKIAEYYETTDIPENEKHILRYFLFACYTGLRYSDLRDLTYGKIIEDKYLSIRVYKTGEPLRLDLPNNAKKLLGTGDRMDLVFNVKSSQYTNSTLKEIMTKLKIPKSISVHCGRHTFATLAGELGVPVEVIKELMGHSNISITMGYVKVMQPSLTKGMMLIDGMCDVEKPQ